MQVATLAGNVNLASPKLEQAQTLPKLPQTDEEVTVPATASAAIRPPRPTLSGGYAVGNPLLGTSAPSRPQLQASIDNGNKLLGKRKLQDLVRQVDPDKRLDPDVEDLLLEIADEFVESVVNFASKLAKHRRSDTLEVKDVQLHLERNWNIRIPSFLPEEVRTIRKTHPTAAFQAKINAIQSAIQLSHRKSNQLFHSNSAS